MRRTRSGICALVLLLMASTGFGEDGSRLLSLDHYVRVKSTAPDIAGQAAQIYVREVVLAGTVLRGGPSADRVVLLYTERARRRKLRSTSRTRITAGWRISPKRASTPSQWT